MKSFYNPLAMHDAPDPCMVFDPKTGYYYALFTCGNRLEIFRSRHAGSVLTDKESKVIFRTPEQGIYSAIWAPELHKIDGRWYIYTSGCTSQETQHKTIFVMGALSDDPFGDWEYLGQPMPWMYCIDPTTYVAPNGIQYLCFCRIEHDELKRPRNVLQIRRMVNPYTVSSQCADVARAEYPWERKEPYDERHLINEGAYFVKNGEKLFVIYSANGMTIDDYCMGMIEFVGDKNDSTSMCNAKNWIKHDKPVFTQANGIYGPGHASFFSSPDGSELWCAYHGMLEKSAVSKARTRYMHIKKIDFDENGYPLLGSPVGTDVEIAPPSGEEE